MIGSGDVPRRRATSAARRWVPIVVGPALHVLVFPPWNVTMLAWVALVPLLLAARWRGARSAALVGLVWGTASIWGLGFWVPIALAFYWQQPLWFGVTFALGASIVCYASYVAVFAAAYAAALRRFAGVPRVLLTAALWVACEFARARLLTGDPWLLLGYALAPRPILAQAADVGGVYLLSFVVAAVNAAVVELAAGMGALPVRRLRPAAITAVGLPIALLAYGALRMQTVPATTAAPIFVRIVQGNLPATSQWRDELYGQGLETYLTMSAAGWPAHEGPSLVVWPENGVTFFLGHEPAYQAAIARAARTLDADFVIGAPHYDDAAAAEPHYFNSAFAITRAGVLGDRYDKRHLLPFAEYFPLRTIELMRRHFERVRSFTPGTGPNVLRTTVGPVATVICFEGIFPDLVRAAMAEGAVLLVNLSNDAWLGRGAGPEQHLGMITLRAIENRTWVVRATTTGVSAIIDPFGRIVARTAGSTAGVLDGTVVPLAVPTLYKRYGDVFAWVCVAAFVLVVAVRPLAALRRRVL